MKFEKLKFLSLFKENIRHHCVLLPNIYGAFNCKLFLEYLSHWQQKPKEAILANPDFFFYTDFTEGSVPLKVEHSRQIIANAQNTSFGNIKVFVIQNIEYSSSSAINALLKIIEEPPQNTMFFLIYNNIEAVIPTVRSRALCLEEFITNEMNFKAICEFFEIESNWGLFVNSGFNFNIYITLMQIEGLSGENFDLSKKVDSIEATKLWAFVELKLNQIAKNCENSWKYEEVSKLLERMCFLKQGISKLNTGKQSVFIELLQKLNEISR